ncbi:Helicase [Macleaya cordata]|uniref:Helicase n=1 Tax=Macleaya cordata TaxID=56857 RepID=A0A200PVR5_MACCD|nr:Helicase [Macleaya cordata]
MAAKASSASSPSNNSQQLSKKKKKQKQKPQGKKNLEVVERMDALPWNSSLPIVDDPFALPLGTGDLEGGFLSLEEIDESEYGLFIPKASSSSKSKKRSRQEDGDSADDSGAASEENVEKKVKKQKAKKKKKKKKSGTVGPTNPSSVSAEEKDKNDNEVVEGEPVVDETEFYAWNELRLHPLLMKSIYKLGFKEPTPIQKVCIPAAAHQGKDVIGAAETGSGKTLAFGLPILQRLLEEREKAAVSLSEKGNDVEKGVHGSALRALILTPTRELALQVTDHLKVVGKMTNIRVVPIVGGMSTEKQERLLRAKPEIIVGTPGRLWELMSGGDQHLVELHSLSFFVLDEADRMIENGHFHELQSIIDMLPMTSGPVEGNPETTQNCVTVSNVQRKKRQTFVFSATIALSADFRKKLKRGSLKSKQSMNEGLSSIEGLSERAGMRADAAIFDLTNASIMADKLEESFIECREEDKDGYLYYLLSVHGQGRTIVFCTSIAALRHISSLLRILGINVWTLHAQMQQRARLKAMDRFRGNENGILIATDVAARGLDIPGVRTVVHYQLPHSAEVYVHRSGRTARASADGCSIALISPNDRSKFASLCKSFSKESLRRFPLDNSYMPEVVKRLSLARQIDKISRKDSQEKAKKTWFERNAESVELDVEDDDSEEERVNSSKQKKISSFNLKKLQEELKTLLSRPLQPKTFSHRFLAGSGVSPLLQHQFKELATNKAGDNNVEESKRRKLVVIGQDCIEPLQALRSGGHEV